MGYDAAIGPKMFAAVGTVFHDVTAGGAIGASVQSGLTNARWQHINFSNSATQYLICVNGADSLRYWDGAAWTTVATYGAVNTNTIVNLTAYQKRLFFAINNSLSLWYLPAGAITGTLGEYQLGQLCKHGGYLMAMATWTVDAGDGADDFLVCVTSEGEVIMFSGTDPANAATWALVGVFYLGRPLSRRCLIQFGGDLALLTDRGLFPVAKALQSASIERTIPLSDKIDQYFNDAGRTLFGVFGWSIDIHTKQSFLIVNVPSTPKTQFVMDLVSKGWSRFTDWNAFCLLYFQGELYYGDTGRVVKAYSGANDFGSNIQCTMITGYNYFDTRGAPKQVSLIRPIFASDGPFSFGMALLGDFARDIPPVTLSATPYVSALWDVALWDIGLWAAGYSITKDWRTVPNYPSYNFGMVVQIATSGVNVQHIATDIQLSQATPIG
jgi:hypothetical protein